MSLSNPFLSEEYTSDRSIIKHAIEQYADVVSRAQGITFEEARETLVEYFKNNKEKYKSRKAKIIIKNKVGDREVKIVPFSSVLKHVQDKNYHFSPSMIGYTNSDEEECVNSIGTRDFIKNRKYYKDLRQEVGKGSDLYSKYNELQNAFKIFNNAQSGAMSSEGTPINNKTGHTSLTSTTRCLTSTANLINEQFIAGNRFFNTPENTFQALTARIKVSDLEKMDQVMMKWNIHYPSVEDVMSMIEHCSRRYWESDAAMNALKLYVSALRPVERAAILYTLDLVQLYKHNPEFISTFFDKYIRTDVDDFEEVEPDNGDRYVLCISKLPKNAPKEKINKLNALHMEIEKEYREFIQVFFKSPIPPSGLFDVVSAVRDCVLTSDTDSSIYTVDDMIAAYTKDRSKGMNLNAVLTYFIRMVSVDQHAQLSANMNVSKRNLSMLGMKNEYYFGAYVTTDMSKHYYASQWMVEGVKNDEMDMEIKGVHLKSSKIAASIREYAQSLMVKTIDAIEHNKKLDAPQLLFEIAELERGVINDIQSGGWHWLSRESVKGAAAYTNPMSEKYQHHSFWEEVFGPKYGPAPELPYSAIKFSVDLGSKSKLNEWLDGIEDLELQARAREWFLTYGKDKMSNLFVPMQRLQNLGAIPHEYQSAIDFRTVIKQNFKCIYEVVHSTGLYFMNDKITRLISDEH